MIEQECCYTLLTTAMHIIEHILYIISETLLQLNKLPLSRVNQLPLLKVILFLSPIPVSSCTLDFYLHPSLFCAANTKKILVSVSWLFLH